MHPTLVRSYVTEQVDELRARLDQRPDLAVRSIDLDGDAMQLFVEFDHVAAATEMVNVASPLQHASGQMIAARWRVPILGRSATTRTLVLLLTLDGYDLDPPTAQLLASDRTLLPPEQWPTSFSDGGIVGRHPLYERPFFCRAGLREYHSHPQHEDEPWHRYRDAIPLADLVIELLADLSTRWRAAA